MKKKYRLMAADGLKNLGPAIGKIGPPRLPLRQVREQLLLDVCY
jgi:hypothetical protein